MKKILKKKLFRYLKREIKEADLKGREEVAAGLPKVFLKEKHITNCKLCLNRTKMLHEIGKCNIVAELGVNRGQFSAEILSITRPDCLHLVDVWNSNRYHEGLFNEVKKKFGGRIESKSVLIHRKLSAEAAAEFADRYFDMIYIDTSHTYKTTKEELLAYLPKMKSDGIIAGHDYSMGNWIKASRYGVIEAVHEFCSNYDWEFIYLTAEPLENQSFAIRKIA
jgi:hypothetical protein